MNLTKRLFMGALGAAILVLSATQIFAATEWKPKEITIILPHGVGGGQDRLTRTLGNVWQKHLGVPIVYENVKGASGRKGYDSFLSKPKDGTYVMSSNLASASIMYAQQKPDWNWNDAVFPAGIFAVDPGAFFVIKDSPYKTMDDLIAAAKGSKKTLGISFWASPDNLVTHQMMDITGAEFQVVPLGKGSQVVTSVLGGHVEVGYTKVANIMKAGDAMRILAVTMDDNPVQGLTQNAPTLNAVVGENTLSVASYRAIVLHPDMVANYPERAKWLLDTFEAAKDDLEYIAAAEKGKVNPKLIVDMDHDQLMDIVKGYWKAFDTFGGIYSKGN